MPVPAHGSVDPRARHLQHVAMTEGTRPAVCVEPLFERPADSAAVFDRDVAGRTVDTDLDERSVRRPADSQVGQIEPQCFQPGSKGLDKTLSEHKKKRGPNFARITEGNVPWVPSMSTERPAEVGDHPAVAPAGRAMRVKAIASLGAAPRRDRDLINSERARLTRERGAQIEHDRPGHAEPLRDLRTYLIARA